MPFSRRDFLQHGTLAALACAAGPLRAWSENRNAPGNIAFQNHIAGKVQTLSRQAFASVVGSAFEVSQSSGNPQPVWLRLLAVNELPALAPMNSAAMAVPPPPTSSTASTSGFMLQFSGAPSQPLLQGSYRFTHDTLGQFILFIVPGGPGTDTYTAVFNELSGATVAPTPPLSRLPGKTRPAFRPAATGEAGSANGSGSGRPAQEPLEPVFGDSLKTKLPE